MYVEGPNPAEPPSSENLTSGQEPPAFDAPTPPLPQQVYFAPPAYTPPPAYAPPPQGYTPYPAYPPPAKPRRTGRLLLIIGVIVVLLIGAGSAGAVLANASLTSTYSAERTVSDYLAAQKGGNSAYMLVNANYLRGDGSYSQYFEAGGLDAMLAIPQNKDITNVNVASTTVVDSNTRTVNVTMTWAGHHVVRAFTVHRDPDRVHFGFYNSWRIDIPFAVITVTLPNQAGSIAVDGLTLPQGAIKDIQVIQGFHKVTMGSTDLYASASQDADTIDGGATVVLPSKISATALAAAKSAVKKAFNLCDAATNADKACLGHTYYAPNQANTIYFFNTLPGYAEIDYTKYVLSLTSDPTTNMKLIVGSQAGKIDATGVCAFTLTVDGTRKYTFKGTWAATLTMSGGSVGYNLNYNCLKSKA